MERWMLALMGLCLAILFTTPEAEAHGRMRITRISRDGAFDHLSVTVGPHVRITDLVDLANRALPNEAPWITESDVIRENPNRIIYVCGPTRRSVQAFSRDPTQWDRCVPGAHRELWLVTGLSYRVPRAHVPDALERAVAAEAATAAANAARAEAERAAREQREARERADAEALTASRTAAGRQASLESQVSTLTVQRETANAVARRASTQNERQFGMGLFWGILAILLVVVPAYLSRRSEFKKRTKKILDEQLAYTKEAQEMWNAERERLKGERAMAEKALTNERKEMKLARERMRTRVARVIYLSRGYFTLTKVAFEQARLAYLDVTIRESGLRTRVAGLERELAPWTERKTQLRDLKATYDRACEALIRAASQKAMCEEVLAELKADDVARTQVRGLLETAENERLAAKLAAEEARSALEVAFEALTGLPYAASPEQESEALHAAKDAKALAEAERAVYRTLSDAKREYFTRLTEERAEQAERIRELEKQLKAQSEAVDALIFKPADEQVWRQEQERRKERTSPLLRAVSAPEAAIPAVDGEQVRTLSRALYFFRRALVPGHAIHFSAATFADLKTILHHSAGCPACPEVMPLLDQFAHAAGEHSGLLTQTPYVPTLPPPPPGTS